MDLHLKGRRALVTGASKGIGRACLELLGHEGCEVLGAARHPPQAPNFLAVDLSERGAAERLAEWAGEVDILVNNAGAIPGGDLASVSEEAWRKGWDLKVHGYINLTRAVYARMKRRRRGVIVNVIGAGGERLSSAYLAGSTGNAGLMAFTRALGGTSDADGIRVVGVNPGPVETDRLLSVYRQIAQSRFGDAERYRDLFKDFPFGRPALPSEIAAAVAFLASDLSAYTSGCILTIDGGGAARWS